MITVSEKVMCSRHFALSTACVRLMGDAERKMIETQRQHAEQVYVYSALSCGKRRRQVILDETLA